MLWDQFENKAKRYKDQTEIIGNATSEEDLIAAQEYDGIVAQFIQVIINQDKQIKELQSKLPKKQRVKVIKKNNQSSYSSSVSSFLAGLTGTNITVMT